jgi:hypothetical protein
MMMLNRLSRRGLSSSAAAFTTPHGLFAALTPTRRVLAVELWPVEGVVTCAVSDEYLGNSTTLEALGGSGGGGGKDVSRLLTDVFLQHDVGGVLLVRRDDDAAPSSFHDDVQNLCTTHGLPLAQWGAREAEDIASARAAAKVAATFGTSAGDFSALKDDAPEDWDLLDCMDGPVWEAFLESQQSTSAGAPVEVLTGLALGRYIGDVVGGWANTFG